MFKFLKKKFKGKRSDSDRYFKMNIKEVIKETEDTSTMVFEKPDRPFNYLPGQFLTLIMPIKDEEVRRSYSLCTSPHTDDLPAITVKRVESGLVSNYLNDHMKAGDHFLVMEPAGHFTPELNPEHKKNYVMFAAGSGITPVMSIMKSILAEEKESKVTLVYQNRNRNNIIFEKALDKMKADHPDRFDRIDVLSQPTAPWKGYAGRLNAASTSDILMDIAGNKVSKGTYYLCGPSEFMSTVFEVLMDFEVPEKQVHKESFYTGGDGKVKVNEPAAAVLEDFEVEILLDGARHTVVVPGNKTILEAALDDNIDMPFSCQSGLCTACRGKLLAGEVEMNEDDGLSEDELNRGYILNCVSHPKGPGVKIEIG